MGPVFHRLPLAEHRSFNPCEGLFLPPNRHTQKTCGGPIGCVCREAGSPGARKIKFRSSGSFRSGYFRRLQCFDHNPSATHSSCGQAAATGQRGDGFSGADSIRCRPGPGGAAEPPEMRPPSGRLCVAQQKIFRKIHTTNCRSWLKDRIAVVFQDTKLRGHRPAISSRRRFGADRRCRHRCQHPGSAPAVPPPPPRFRGRAIRGAYGLRGPRP